MEAKRHERSKWKGISGVSGCKVGRWEHRAVKVGKGEYHAVEVGGGIIGL